MLTLAAWNICHGGGRRLPRIILRLLDLDADVVALSEVRWPAAGQLIGILADHGWRWHAAARVGRGNGLLVLSRLPMCSEYGEHQKHAGHEEHGEHPPPTGGVRPSMLPCRCESGPGSPGRPLDLLAVHLPHEPRLRVAAWRGVERRARAATGDLAVVGDFNAPPRGHPALAKADAVAMGRLASLGVVRVPAADPDGVTWRGNLGSAEIDGAFVSGRLRDRVSSVRIVAEALDERESDHAPIRVEVLAAGEKRK